MNHRSLAICAVGVLLLCWSNLSAQKLSQALSAQIRQSHSDEFIRAVIQMQAQLPLSELEALAEGKSRKETRESVVSRVREFASQTQRGVLELLEQFKDQGDVRVMHSIQTTNKIAIVAKPVAFRVLEQRGDIRLIYTEQPAFVVCTNTWNVEKINAHLVWSGMGLNGSGIRVGVLDTGTDYDHTDLHNNIWNNLGEDADGDGHTLEWNGSRWVLDPGDLNGIDNDSNGYADDLVGWDFYTGYPHPLDQDNDPMDEESHGTHVSGTVAGDGSAGTQTGVAPRASIMVLKVLNSYGNSVPSAVEAAIDYGVMNGADILSLSIGWVYGVHYQPGSPDDPRAGFRQACDAAKAAGVVICVAAGNERIWSDPPVPNNIRTPGDVPSVITVGATDITDFIASFSSAGPVTWQDVPAYNDYPYPPGLIKPDVCAPGANITSTFLGGGYQGGWDGTSMATPAVSGLVALMLQANPTLTPDQTKNQIEQTAIELGSSGKDVLYGSGRTDAYQAVKSTIENYGGTLSGQVQLTESLTIQAGATLIISAGTTVLIEPDVGAVLKVYGTLDVQGTQSEPVIFDRNGSSGNWTGIRLKANSTGNINHATIRNASKGVWVDLSDNVAVDNCTIENFANQGIYLNGSSAIIQNCTIRNGNGASHGIYVFGASASPTIVNTTVNGAPFSGGAAIGIEITGTGPSSSSVSALIEGNSISNCGDSGILTVNSEPNIKKCYISGCNLGIRVGTSASPDIRDSNIHGNLAGLFLEQSHPFNSNDKIRFNNFGWPNGGPPCNLAGVFINYLQADNTFLNYKKNNFYDGAGGSSFFDIVNYTSTTVLAKGNYWASQNLSGPVNANNPETSPNPDAGPGGASGKVAAEKDDSSENPTPKTFILSQNYPNPFNPSTTIRIELPQRSRVRLQIYDERGGLIRAIAQEQEYDRGTIALEWDGANAVNTPVTSGIYFYRLSAVGLEDGRRFSQSRKLVLLR